MTTTPEEAAALFGLPPPPATSPTTTEAAEHAEAALAAELAAELALTIEAGGVADDAPDSRSDLRVKVSWSARMQVPDGRVIELRVLDISEGGVGLMGDEPIPAHTVVDFEMDAPPLDDGGEITHVSGRIKTTYTVVHGSNVRCGATWQAPPAGLERVKKWMRLNPGPSA